MYILSTTLYVSDYKVNKYIYKYMNNWNIDKPDDRLFDPQYVRFYWEFLLVSDWGYCVISFIPKDAVGLNF